MTANIVPITDNVPALRGKSVNQPPSGARRRTSSLMVIAAVTTTDEDKCGDPDAVRATTRDPGSAGSLTNRELLDMHHPWGAPRHGTILSRTRTLSSSMPSVRRCGRASSTQAVRAAKPRSITFWKCFGSSPRTPSPHCLATCAVPVRVSPLPKLGRDRRQCAQPPPIRQREQLKCQGL